MRYSDKTTTGASTNPGKPPQNHPTTNQPHNQPHEPCGMAAAAMGGPPLNGGCMPPPCSPIAPSLSHAITIPFHPPPLPSDGEPLGYPAGAAPGSVMYPSPRVPLPARYPSRLAGVPGKPVTPSWAHAPACGRRVSKGTARRGWGAALPGNRVRLALRYLQPSRPLRGMRPLLPSTLPAPPMPCGVREPCGVQVNNHAPV